MDKQKLIQSIYFFMVCVIFFAFLQLFQEQLVYQYDTFRNQPWRWWTGHWVHVGWIHYILNIIAFACIPFLFPNIKNRIILGLLIVLSPLLSFCFFWNYPNIATYAGLSGVLHGLYTYLAVIHLSNHKERRFALFILVIIFLKILWEHYFGSFNTEQLIGSPVLIQAHLWGAIWGGILAMMSLLLKIRATH